VRILIFGAKQGGKEYYNYIKQHDTGTSVEAFVDNNPVLIGTRIDDIPIISPNEIINLQFDKIIIATLKSPLVFEILSQLKDMGISEEKIEHPITRLTCADILGYDEYTDSRVLWLRNLSCHVYKNDIHGNVAECGVYRGYFARFINKYFPDKVLYLFDTFGGFSIQDIEKELSLGDDSFAKSAVALDKNRLKDTSVESVMQQMPHPEKCIIKKGYFPETAIGIEDSFCFVNLDMDLYQPMLAGLNFFWDKMTRGGVILLHDYYNLTWKGVAQAVEDFEKTIGKNICKTPIGDFISMALIKD
jgi:hypothetical protein